MPAVNHDTLVRRLALILVKLNQGEKLDPAALAAEFNVNLRTIQRDFNERFNYLPLEKSQGKYYLNPAFLGKLTLKDLHRFAGLAGISGLFPDQSEDALHAMLETRVGSSLLVKGHQYEDLRGKEQTFKLLEGAIVARQQVTFDYQSAGISKHYEVEPYKMINNKGIWYLAAKHNNKLKTFTFSKLEWLAVFNTTYAYDKSLDERLAEEDGIWLSEQPFKVVLKVGGAAASYFKRRKLIANQVIEKELADGSLILSANVGHHNQVVPIIKYWIPHVRVINPAELQGDIDDELRSYLLDR